MQTTTSVPTFPKHDLKYDGLYHALLNKLKDEKLFVLQVGAFDGTTYDELNKHLKDNLNWHAMLIEPMPAPFKVLKEETYKHRPDFIFENIAITEKTETRQVWSIPYELKDDPNLPTWATGCSTLMKHSNSLFGKHSTKEEFEAVQKYIVIDFVKCCHLNTLLKKHNIEKIDIVNIDAEGYDWRILKQINLEINKPKIIHFEFFNLTEEDYGEARTHLAMYGYDLYSFENNITATTIKLNIVEKKPTFFQKLKNLFS